jgi:undecaprenyl-diphosphatase
MTTTLDHTLFHYINQGLASPLLDYLCPLARDKYTWLPFYIIGGCYVLYRYKMRGLWLIVFAVLTIALCDQASNLIKLLTHRLRPCFVEPQVRLLVAGCSHTFSFTSNHAANHFGLAVFLSLSFSKLRWLPVLLVAWAGFIAFSQVYVGLHYPADVAGGALLGTLVGFITFSIFRHLEKRYFGTNNASL